MKQFVRYGLVGLVSNGLLYLFYIIQTHFAVTPELAATIAYVLGVCWTYIINKGWSFASDASHSNAAPKYILTYLLGFFLTIGILTFGYRVLEIPHFMSQLIAIGITAVAIFLSLKYWVFATPSSIE